MQTGDPPPPPVVHQAFLDQQHFGQPAPMVSSSPVTTAVNTNSPLIFDTRVTPSPIP